MNQTEDINNLEQLYVEITDDIDLSTVEEPDIWNGYLMYFYGHITGKDVTRDGVTRQPIISGMSGDRYLIYGWFGGSISNLTFDMKGNAATINYICGKLNGAFQNCTMNDIEIISTDENGNDTPILLPTNNQANYAPFTYSMYGNFTMPLRYNNDKQKKPLFSRGLSVCRLLFNSFSKLKIDENYKEKRRLFY